MRLLYVNCIKKSIYTKGLYIHSFSTEIIKYAFIDTHNLVCGVEDLGWRIDWSRFRLYLQNKYLVSKAYLFLGFIKQNEFYYKELETVGFTLIFKDVYQKRANVDVELAMRVLMDIKDFDSAVIVSGDGDFHSLIKYLKGLHKLKICIGISPETCSTMIKKITEGKIGFINSLEKRIGSLK